MLTPEEETYVRWMIRNPGEKISVRAHNYFPTSFTNVNPITDATYSLGSATRRWLNVYLSGIVTSDGGFETGAGWIIKDDGSGDLVAVDSSGSSSYKAVPFGTGSAGNFEVLSKSGAASIRLYQDDNGVSAIYSTNFLHIATDKMVVDFSGVFNVYYNVSTQGLGLAPIFGLDNRTGLTAVDAAAKTLYTATAAGQLYRFMARILATAGTSPSATYTLKWTEGGATITKTLTISALDADSDLSVLVQPDDATAITAQLTAISGTGTTVNVAASVEELA